MEKAFRKRTELQIRLIKRIVRRRYQKQPRLLRKKIRFLIRPIMYQLNVSKNKKKTDASSKKEELERYDRQMRIPLIDQEKIGNAKIVVFGCGGIGSNVIESLTRSGVQEFKIIDFDEVELSNLNRQILFTSNCVGNLKVDAAKKRIIDINPQANVMTYNIRLDYPINMNVFQIDERDYPHQISLLDEMIKWGDIILNATDYYGAPYLINDLCVKNARPYYWGGINYFQGNIFSYRPNNGCFRCIFNGNNLNERELHNRYKRPENSEKGANLGTSVCMTGNYIAEMIMHDICGIINPIHNRYIIIDFLNSKINKIPIKQDTDCFCSHLIF